MKYSKFLLAFSGIVIILVSLVIGINFFVLNNSNPKKPELIISNVSSKQVSKSVYDSQNQFNTFKIPANTIYSLTIHLDMIFYKPTTLDNFFLNQCGFTGSFNFTVNWQFVPQMWNCPIPGTQTYSPGKYSFSLQEDIVPSNIHTNVTYPVPLPLQVVSTFSTKIHYNSQVYNLTLQNNETLNIENIELTNTTNSNSQISYNLKAFIDYYTNESFNVSTTSCNSLFGLKIIFPTSWSISELTCYHLYSPSNSTIMYNGTSVYSLNYSLLFPGNQVWSSNTTLPPQLSFKVYFSPHHLLSDMYTMILD